MRNIRLDLEYDGRNYCGWQWQPNAPTIEAVVKQSIERMVHHSITPYSSGRTDAGVHAEQHVVNFYTHTDITPFAFLNGLNSILPDDIAVYRVMEMPRDWNARHDAIEREYRYRFYHHEAPSVFWRPRSYWIRRSFNIDAMNQSASYLVGKHDFSAFRSNQCDADNPVRCLLDVVIQQQLPFIDINVRGHAFLRHQVRIIAGTLFYVGLGKWPTERVKAILESKNRDNAGPTMPAHALTLIAIRYPGDEEHFAKKEWLIRK